jgi:hypothetical protein
MRRGLRRALAFARCGPVTLGPRRMRIGLTAVEQPATPTLPTTAIVMRVPCPHCGTHTGRVEQRACNACVFCTACGAFQYNAPAKERRTWLLTSPVRCYTPPHPE